MMRKLWLRIAPFLLLNVSGCSRLNNDVLPVVKQCGASADDVAGGQDQGSGLVFLKIVFPEGNALDAESALMLDAHQFDTSGNSDTLKPTSKGCLVVNRSQGMRSVQGRVRSHSFHMETPELARLPAGSVFHVRLKENLKVAACWNGRGRLPNPDFSTLQLVAQGGSRLREDDLALMKVLFIPRSGANGLSHPIPLKVTEQGCVEIDPHLGPGVIRISSLDGKRVAFATTESLAFAREPLPVKLFDAKGTALRLDIGCPAGAFKSNGPLSFSFRPPTAFPLEAMEIGFDFVDAHTGVSTVTPFVNAAVSEGEFASDLASKLPKDGQFSLKPKLRIFGVNVEPFSTSQCVFELDTSPPAPPHLAGLPGGKQPFHVRNGFVPQVAADDETILEACMGKPGECDTLSRTPGALPPLNTLGHQVVCLRSYDSAGNVSSRSCTEFMVDSAQPAPFAFEWITPELRSPFPHLTGDFPASSESGASFSGTLSGRIVLSEVPDDAASKSELLESLQCRVDVYSSTGLLVPTQAVACQGCEPNDGTGWAHCGAEGDIAVRMDPASEDLRDGTIRLGLKVADRTGNEREISTSFRYPSLPFRTIFRDRAGQSAGRTLALRNGTQAGSLLVGRNDRLELCSASGPCTPVIFDELSQKSHFVGSLRFSAAGMPTATSDGFSKIEIMDMDEDDSGRWWITTRDHGVAVLERVTGAPTFSIVKDTVTASKCDVPRDIRLPRADVRENTGWCYNRSFVLAPDMGKAYLITRAGILAFDPNDAWREQVGRKTLKPLSVNGIPYPSNASLPTACDDPAWTSRLKAGDAFSEGEFCWEQFLGVSSESDVSSLTVGARIWYWSFQGVLIVHDLGRSIPNVTVVSADDEHPDFPKRLAFQKSPAGTSSGRGRDGVLWSHSASGIEAFDEATHLPLKGHFQKTPCAAIFENAEPILALAVNADGKLSIASQDRIAFETATGCRTVSRHSSRAAFWSNPASDEGIIDLTFDSKDQLFVKTHSGVYLFGGDVALLSLPSSVLRLNSQDSGPVASSQAFVPNARKGEEGIGFHGDALFAFSRDIVVYKNDERAHSETSLPLVDSFRLALPLRSTASVVVAGLEVAEGGRTSRQRYSLLGPVLAWLESFGLRTAVPTISSSLSALNLAGAPRWLAETLGSATLVATNRTTQVPMPGDSIDWRASWEVEWADALLLDATPSPKKRCSDPVVSRETPFSGHLHSMRILGETDRVLAFATTEGLLTVPLKSLEEARSHDALCSAIASATLVLEGDFSSAHFTQEGAIITQPASTGEPETVSSDNLELKGWTLGDQTAHRKRGLGFFAGNARVVGSTGGAEGTTWILEEGDSNGTGENESILWNIDERRSRAKSITLCPVSLEREDCLPSPKLAFHEPSGTLWSLLLDGRILAFRPFQ